MNASAKFGVAFLVVALLLAQPFGKCLAKSETAMRHEGCTAPVENGCAMPDCACASGIPGLAVPAGWYDGQPAAVAPSARADEADVPVLEVPEPESLRRAGNHRFLALHQLLI